MQPFPSMPSFLAISWPSCEFVVSDAKIIHGGLGCSPGLRSVWARIGGICGRCCPEETYRHREIAATYPILGDWRQYCTGFGEAAHGQTPTAS
jgi:hypothetical protein